MHARAWNTGDGPKTIFTDGVKWLRENAVLLPGVTTAARLVSRIRDEALDELYATLAGLPGPHLAARLEGLVTVPDGARYSGLELWRRGPSKPTGRSLERGLTRVAEVSGTGIGRLDLEAHVPRRRVVDLARHGMAARAQALRRLGDERRLATLVATVAYLEGRAIDDCLELLDLLMTTDLLSKAEKAAGDEQKRRHPSLVRHSARLAAAVEVLFDVTDSGGELTLEQVWESIEAVVPRGELREAVDAVADMVPPPGSDADTEMRAHLTERIATVTPFLTILTEVIGFGAAPEGEQALAAMKALPRLLDRRTRITAADIDLGLLTGSWRVLVMPKGGGVDRSAWVFCVLTAFHRHLRRREIYAEASTRWRDPRAQLLAGEKLARAKVTAMTDLQLGEDPDSLLAEQSRALDDALRDVAAQVSAGTIDTTVDDQGRLHLPKLSAIPDRRGAGRAVPGLAIPPGVHRLPIQLVPAEEQHRDHAVVEQVFADWTDGPLAHLPSGSFAANAAWLTCAAITCNLLRAAGCLASRFHARARGATIRADLIDVAARLARRGRSQLTLHLPQYWHRGSEWLALFEAACGPPARAA